MNSLFNKSILALLVLGGLFVSHESKAEYKLTDKHKYALLVSNINHVKAALKTAEQLIDNYSGYDAFEIVICGKMVNTLSSKEMASMIEKAKKTNVTLSVCGMSLHKFEIDEHKLPPYLNVVPNGLIRVFNLQNEGYNTIEL